MKTKITTLLLAGILFLFLIRCEKEELTIPTNPNFSISPGSTNSLYAALGLKKLLRYRHSVYHDNILFTTSGIVPTGYQAAGDLGYVFTKKTSSTVPLYQYHDRLHNADERYFYSIDYLATENGIYFISDVDGILYYYEGVVGYVYPSNISGTKPVYEYRWTTPARILCLSIH